MPIQTYTPSAYSDALFLAYAGVAFDDPKTFTSHLNKRVDALYFLNPTQCMLLKIRDIIISGGGTIAVYNATGGSLAAGPVRITGYNVANSAFTIALADADTNTPANLLLLSALADATAGLGYVAGTFTSSLDTSAIAVGTEVYLSATGTVTQTAPSGADQIVQPIGRVKTQAVAGVIAGFIQNPTKFGTSYYQPLSITAAKIATGTILNAQINAAAAIDVSKLGTGGTIPANSGVNLTALNATQLTSGTVPDARFPATLPAVSGVNLTALNATQLTSGTVPDARFPATLPAVSGVNLTALNGSNIASGTVAIARGGTGQGTATTAFDALAPTTTQGDIIYHNGTNNVRLAKGTGLQILRMNAGATAPEWAAATSSLTGVTNSASPYLTALGDSAGTSVTGLYNTTIGKSAGDLVTTGIENTLVGYFAGSGIASGGQNTALGMTAGRCTGSGNTSVGAYAGGLSVLSTYSNCTQVGYNAGRDINTGTENVFVGMSAGKAVTSGGQNVMIGFAAGTATGGTAQTDNTHVGQSAGRANTANQNTFIGSNAGKANTSGTGQCFAGYNAGLLVTGNDNTIYGFASGDAFTTGARNSLFGKDSGGAAGATAMTDTAMFGYQAGLLNTADQNTFVGSSCGDTNTSGTGQVFVGYQAGHLVTGSNNTVVGHQAGDAFTTGARNSLFGKDSGGAAGATAMTDTAMFGYQAGLLNTADQNTFVGSSCGDTNTSGTGQVFVGYQAGHLVTGSNNTVIGHQAGDAFTTGARNSLFGKDSGGAAGATAMTDTAMFGYQAGLVNTADQNSFFGASCGQANTSGTGQAFFGYNAGKLVTGNDNTIFGNAAGDAFTTGARNSLFGKDSGGAAGATAMTDTAMFGYQAGLVNTADQNSFFGASCGQANTSGTGQAFFGYNAGKLVTGSNNTIFGNAAGDAFTTGARNSLFGKDAGGAAGATAMTDTSMFGYQAGLVNTADQNTFIGASCGQANTSGTGQCFVGYNAGKLVTGNDNTIVGNAAGDSFTTGTGNTLIGKDAGGAAAATSMSATTIIGCQAGLLNTQGQNVFVGSLAGQSNTSGSGQVFMGYAAGNNVTGNANTILGNQAASSTLTTGTDNVIIGINADTLAAATTGGIALGSAAKCSSNTFVAGSTSSAATNVYFGKGITNATATAYTINGTGGSGSDNAGAALQLAGGIGTGTSKGGNLVCRTAFSIGTGSTAQTLVDRYIVVAQGKALTDAVATTIATITLSAGEMGGGVITATIRCTDGTDMQSFTQTIEYAVVQKAGTYTSTITATAGAKAVSAGTLTTTWTITSAGAIQVSADTSLVPSGTNAFVIYYSIENHSQSAITLP